MILDTKVLPNVSVVEQEYQFLRSVVFSKLHNFFSNKPEAHDSIKLAIEKKWEGIAVGADFAWLALRGIKTENSPEEFLVDFLQGDVKRPVFVNSSSAGSWLDKVVENQNNNILRDLNDKTTITVGIENCQEAQSRYIAVLQFLKMHWPEAEACVQSLVSHVVWVSSSEFVSSSNQTALGLIFVCPKPTWTLAHFLEAIVHESAHIELRARQLVDPMLKNPQMMSVSPLRPDPRPLNGILHATFVLARTCTGLQLLSLHGDNESIREEASRQFLEYRKKLTEGIQTLRRDAQFTKAGELLIADIEKVGNELLSTPAIPVDAV